jgi:hypothetical protein
MRVKSHQLPITIRMATEFTEDSPPARSRQTGLARASHSLSAQGNAPPVARDIGCHCCLRKRGVTASWTFPFRRNIKPSSFRKCQKTIKDRKVRIGLG